jgi:hypothetical protein
LDDAAGKIVLVGLVESDDEQRHKVKEQVHEICMRHVSAIVNETNKQTSKPTHTHHK